MKKLVVLAAVAVLCAACSHDTGPGGTHESLEAFDGCCPAAGIEYYCDYRLVYVGGVIRLLRDVDGGRS